GVFYSVLQDMEPLVQDGAVQLDDFGAERAQYGLGICGRSGGNFDGEITIGIEFDTTQAGPYQRPRKIGRFRRKRRMIEHFGLEVGIGKASYANSRGLDRLQDGLPAQQEKISRG